MLDDISESTAAEMVAMSEGEVEVEVRGEVVCGSMIMVSEWNS